MSRSGSRKPGRSAEALSSKQFGTAKGHDENDAKHSTNSNDMKKRTKHSLGTPDRLQEHEYDKNQMTI